MGEERIKIYGEDKLFFVLDSFFRSLRQFYEQLLWLWQMSFKNLYFKIENLDITEN